MPSPARIAAYEALRAVHEDRVTLPDALERVRAGLTDARDRALASEIATGVMRWQAALDHITEHVARRPLARLDPEALDVIRLSVYQLLHLDRVPASAVVHDAVELVRRAGRSSAASFVNAVLRNVQRAGGALPLPTRDQPLDYLAVTLSHPRWLAARWLARVGIDAAEAWERFNNAPAPVTLRANRLRTTREALADELRARGVESQPTQYSAEGLILTGGGAAASSAAVEGCCVLQDEASQLVTALVGASPGERVLDVCAAPGGKTTAMAGDMRDHGLIVAADIRPRRVGLLSALVQRAGAGCVHVVRLDAERPLPLRASFDCVLVDAPCSGLGVIRREPDIRWRRRPTDLARLARAQLRILTNAAQAVRAGGRLVYATCSTEPEENEAVVAAFLEQHPRFRLRAATPGDGDVARLPHSVIDAQGFLRTLPYLHDLEGFFGAVLVCRG